MGLALGRNTPILTPVCHRILAGVTRRAAAEQRPVRKAVPLPVHIFKQALIRMTTQYHNIWQIPIPTFRGMVAMILQFYTYCRLSDLSGVKACHLQCDRDSQGTQIIRITFPHSKNDQLNDSRDSLIVVEEGNMCPVFLLCRYYDRMGFQFFNGTDLDTNYLLCRSRTINTENGHTTVSDGKYQISLSTLLSYSTLVQTGRIPAACRTEIRQNDRYNMGI